MGSFYRSALPKLSQHRVLSGLLLLLRRRRRGRRRGQRHGCKRDAVEVGDEGLPAATKGPVQGLMGTEGTERSVMHTHDPKYA